MRRLPRSTVHESRCMRVLRTKQPHKVVSEMPFVKAVKNETCRHRPKNCVNRANYGAETVEIGDVGHFLSRLHSLLARVSQHTISKKLLRNMPGRDPQVRVGNVIEEEPPKALWQRSRPRTVFHCEFHQSSTNTMTTPNGAAWGLDSCPRSHAIFEVEHVNHA